jgi:hypothetical protein
MKGFFVQASGYNRLAERYPAEGGSEGPAHTMQTVQFGPVRYRRCVTVHVSDQGLYLQPCLFYVRYPPILIPWDEVVRVRPSRIHAWSQARLLSIGEPEVGTIRVEMGLFKLIQPYLSPKLSEQT